jgi:outer membrane protein OmpA-like peptidoglycan-associated protein
MEVTETDAKGAYSIELETGTLYDIRILKNGKLRFEESYEIVDHNELQTRYFHIEYDPKVDEKRNNAETPATSANSKSEIKKEKKSVTDQKKKIDAAIIDITKLSGTVTGANGQGLEASVVLTGQTLDGQAFYERTHAGGEGKFSLEITAMRSVDVLVLKEGHKPYAAKWYLDNGGNNITQKSVRLDSLDGEMNFNVFGVTFKSGSAKIDPEGLPILDALAEMLSKSSPSNVLVEGHTDNSGDSTANLRLSEQRAKAVADYLSRKSGLKADIFETVGRGDTAPLVSNDDEREGRELNRRVSFKIGK